MPNNNRAPDKVFVVFVNQTTGELTGFDSCTITSGSTYDAVRKNGGDGEYEQFARSTLAEAIKVARAYLINRSGQNVCDPNHAVTLPPTRTNISGKVFYHNFRAPPKTPA